MKFQPILVFGVRKPSRPTPAQRKDEKEKEYSEEGWEVLKGLFDDYSEGEEFDLE